MSKQHARRTVRDYDHKRGTYSPELMAACKCGWESGKWEDKAQAAQSFATHKAQHLGRGGEG